MLGMEEDPLEVLRDFLGRERGGSLVHPPGLWGILPGVSLSLPASPLRTSRVSPSIPSIVVLTGTYEGSKLDAVLLSPAVTLGSCHLVQKRGDSAGKPSAKGP